jgi:hypothetical protein
MISLLATMLAKDQLLMAMLANDHFARDDARKPSVQLQ